MKNNILITGLPRSGTSFLCTKLHMIPNTAIINEPVEATQAFTPGSGVDLKGIYRDFRVAIAAGQAVPNKIVDGKFIEDTQFVDQRALYTPNIDKSDFTLGIKNTMIFLANIHKITSEHPDLKIIACIRHPFDTIGSWKNVPFEHLNKGQPRFLLNKVDENIGKVISKIIDEPEIEKRHTMIYRFLARQILKHREKLIVVRCEDLISSPQKVLDPICDELGLPSTNFGEDNKIRKRTSLLSSKYTRMISAGCGEIASEFGYKL